MRILEKFFLKRPTDQEVLRYVMFAGMFTLANVVLLLFLAVIDPIYAAIYMPFYFLVLIAMGVMSAHYENVAEMRKIRDELIFEMHLLKSASKELKPAWGKQK